MKEAVVPTPRIRRTLLLAMLAATSASGVQAATLDEALRGGQASLDLRYRLETVSQDNALKDATASTLRTRLGYMTGKYRDASAYVEMSHVADPTSDYNSGRNDKTEYSVVADPDVTVLNQAYLSYAGVPDTAIKIGRQRLILDNARFVGNVGWRQTEQTFDAVSLTNRSLPDTGLTYAHLTDVNTITGLNAGLSANLANLNYQGLPGVAVVAYGYLLDYDQSTALSTATYGARVSGAMDSGKWSLPYTVEYARQSDYGDNPAGFDLDYWLVEIGAGVAGVTLKAGYELLGSDGVNSFRTPLATLHAFNGWADQFLTTPATGLEDRYVSLAGSALGLKLAAIYHDFSADRGSDDFGSEWDLSATRPINKTYSVMAKFAGYRAGDASGKVDTDKLWIMAEAKF